MSLQRRLFLSFLLFPFSVPLVFRAPRADLSNSHVVSCRYSSDLGRQGGYLPPSDSLASLASTSNLSSSMIGEPRLDWALERECEIVRLEEENKALREMLGLGPPGEEEKQLEGGGTERSREVVGR